MVKYSREPDNRIKSCNARGSDLQVHSKNTASKFIHLSNSLGSPRVWKKSMKIEQEDLGIPRIQ